MLSTSSSFNRALVALYDIAERASHDDFPVEALRLLRPWIRFDCATLGVIVASAEGIHVTPLAQVNVRTLQATQNDDMMHLVGSERISNMLLYGLPSPALVCSDASYAPRSTESGHLGSSSCDAVCCPAMQHRMLFSECPPHAHGSTRWIALCRDGRSCFTAEEAARLRLAWCHLLRAMDLNRRFVLIRHNHEQTGRASALINAQGRIIVADTDFHHLLRKEWRSYSNTLIPGEAMDCFASGRTVYRGRSIELEVAPRGTYLTCTANRLSGLEGLTRSEYLVAQRFANGLSHKSIARELGISPHTVRNQIAHLYNKLGINNKAALARHIAASRRPDGDGGSSV